MFRILIVEDDADLLDILEVVLSGSGFLPTKATNGQEALTLFEGNHYDLIITDIMMPLMDGFNLSSKIRRMNPNIPIIMLTALDLYLYKEKGYECGTDDYITKPVDFKELILKIHALMRRYSIVSSNRLNHKDLVLDYLTKSAFINQTQVELTTKEFELLFRLVSMPGRIFTREQLMDEIWGYDSESFERTVDTHINRIRNKVTTQTLEIKTVRGLGYKAVLK